MGYAIRGETKASGATKLLFCTTGILLRRLEQDPSLAGTTHVLVDEVHERTLESDFLLLALKKLLQKQAHSSAPPTLSVRVWEERDGSLQQPPNTRHPGVASNFDRFF